MARSRIPGVAITLPRVSIPERGHVDVSTSQWQAMAASSAFWTAIDRGILKIGQLSERRRRIYAGGYVGRIQCGSIDVELVEKIPGALRSLLRFATTSSFRVERLPAPASELGELIALLIEQFLEALSRYVSRGREFEYRRQQFRGSLIGGRIDVTKSIQLRARGLNHVLAFDRNVLTFATESNRVLTFALREIGKLRALASLSDDIVRRARGFAILFEDCLDSKLVVARRQEVLRTADDLLDRVANPLLRDALTLGRVIIAHESFEATQPLGGQVPRSWLLNLESLFEAAVRRVLANIGAGRFVVSKGQAPAPPVFSNAGDEYRAHPDLLVRFQDALPAVGDVKYKAWTGSADHADIYQLLAHGAAYDASRCFLIYPGETYSERNLGTAATGPRSWLFQIDVTRMDEDLLRVSNALGFIENPAEVA